MDAIAVALSQFADPMHLAALVGGVLIGLVIGVIPGLGGIFGLTLLVPATYMLDPTLAMVMLLGMASVTTTSDTIPAVLIGVPGTVGAAATVLDGHALARRGEAARALGAAYAASLIGGLFGAFLLALSVPVMRPLALMLTFPDLLAITVFSLTLVAMLSGGHQLKGMLAALLGALAAYIGLDPQEGVARWTFGEVYLWDGLPVAIVFLGLFGLPELAAILGRGRIDTAAAPPEPGGLRRGIGEALRAWPLVLRSGGIGALLGAVPGIGVTVIEWIAYGDAARRPGPGPAFGEGNIRGVIAPESANNAKEGGALLPTLAFGIPGSATMSILLGAFAVHGLVPGPDLLRDHAPLVVTLILTVALANLLGAAICLGATPALARLARVPASSLVPVALVFVTLGAFQSAHDPRDFAALLGFGALGMAMKGLGWSRPAFALGFVLGPNLERFFFLSHQISGWSWLGRPLVLVLLAAAAATVLRQTLRRMRARAGRDRARAPAAERLMLGLMLLLAAGALATALAMPIAAGIFPGIVAGLAVALSAGLLAASVLSRPAAAPSASPMPGLRFLAATLGLALLILGFGHIAGPTLFLLAAAARFRRPPLLAALATAAAVALACYAIFDLAAPQSWPLPWAARLLPGG